MTHLKHFQKTIRTLSFLVALFGSFSVYAHKTIGITQIVDHPSLNAIREGIIEELASAGFVEGETVTVVFENANGNPTTAAQIAQKFAGMTFDVIVPITTPSAQAIVQQIKTTPIVFAAISDPLAAKVVSSLDHPTGNVTGVADIPPVEEQLNFIQGCLPNLKTLGVVYSPGEVHNVTFLEKLKPLAQKKQIKIITAAAPKSSDVQTAAKGLVNRVDAIFVGVDNTVVSGLEALVKVCLDADKPLFVSDPESVERGALAAYAYDQRQLGRQVGAMVVQILKGKKPSQMPVETPTGLKLYINPQTAEKLKVTCSTATPFEKE